MQEYGVLLDDDTVRFERLLPAPIERVWAHITEADKRARWLAGGDFQLDADGNIELVFRNSALSTEPDDPPPPQHADLPDVMRFGGRITEIDPPRLLAHTWEYDDECSEVRYELEPLGDETRLVLTHRLVGSREHVISACAGWHAHFHILITVLAEETPPAFWKTHTPLENAYRDRLSG